MQACTPDQLTASWVRHVGRVKELLAQYDASGSEERMAELARVMLQWVGAQRAQHAHHAQRAVQASCAACLPHWLAAVQAPCTCVSKLLARSYRRRSC